MGSMTRLKTIEVLRSLFARYGIPEEVTVSNNGYHWKSSLNSWSRMESSLPGFHCTILHLIELLDVLYRRFWPSKCWMAKQIPSVWSINWPTFLFWIVAHLILSLDNLQLSSVWDDRLGTVSHYWNPTLAEPWMSNSWISKSATSWMKWSWFVIAWRRGVERWISGRITRVKGLRTYLVRFEDQKRFVHVDHSKSARWIQSSSSQAEMKSGAWSPSEPLVNTFETEVPDAGDVEPRNRRQLRWHQNHHWETLWREQVPKGHHCHCAQHWGTLVGRGEHQADSKPKYEHSLSTWRTLNIVYLLDVHFYCSCCYVNQPIYSSVIY